MSEDVDLYIKLKLGIFFIIWYNLHSKVMVFSQIVNLKIDFSTLFLSLNISYLFFNKNEWD